MGDIKKRVTAIQGIPVSSIPPTAGQVLQFNGTEYVPTTLPFAGPSSIPGLQFWLRSDMGVTLSGSEVTAWADQSGIGDSNRNMNGVGGSQNPTFNATDSSYNNKPSISFASGSSQYMTSAGNWSPTISEPWTVFVVGNDDGVGSVVEAYFNGGGSASIYGMVYIDTSDGHYAIYSGTVCDSSIPALGIPIVLRGEFSDPHSSLSISTNTPNISNQTAGIATLGVTGVYLGAQNSGTGCLNGKIVEVIVYNSILSSTNIAQVQNYLSIRYGISIGP